MHIGITHMRRCDRDSGSLSLKPDVYYFRSCALGLMLQNSVRWKTICQNNEPIRVSAVCAPERRAVCAPAHRAGSV